MDRLKKSRDLEISKNWEPMPNLFVTPEIFSKMTLIGGSTILNDDLKCQSPFLYVLRIFIPSGS